MKIKLFTRTPDDADKLIRSIDKQFRSSSRFIPAMTLFEESYLRIRAEKLRALHQLKQADLIASLKRLEKPLKLNRGVVENLLKIHQFTQLCAAQRSIQPTAREQWLAVSTFDGVSGLPQSRLDKLTESFPKTSPRLKREFDYALSRLVQLAVRDAFDNDWYKFKMAAVIFEHRLHETKTVTYAMFSRGKATRGYFVVGGTSVAIDAIPYFRFREDEIQYLIRHPQFARVSPEFFNFLRTWRFRGSMRAMPEGTVAFANEPILEVTTDPLSATLIECLLSPIVDTVTTSATKVSRIVNAARGIPVVEGGTRRSGHALLGAYGALIGLAIGTSNTKISQMLNTLPYGSMEHALFGLFPNELRTLIAYDRLFPNSTALIDENEIMEGLRLAIIASGRGLGGVRTDSELAGVGLGPTTRTMRELLDDFEYYDSKILVSNRIDEFELLKWTPETAAYQSILVGTAAQAPPDANGSNIVFKLVEVRDEATDEVRGIAKKSVGKVGIPGATDVFRVTSPLDHRASHDVITIRGVSVDQGTPLLVPALNDDGSRVLPRWSMAETAARTRAQLAMFAPEVLDPRAPAGVYPVHIADELKAKTERVLAAKSTRGYRVGIQIGSFDPVTDAHVKIAERSRRLYQFDRLIAVPAAQASADGAAFTHPAERRLKLLRERYLPLGLEVDAREVESSEPRFTLDTVKRMRREILSEHADARVYIVVGEDVFADLIDQTNDGRWTKHQAELLDGSYGWIVHRRTTDGALEIPGELLEPHWERLGPNHFENNKTGAVIHGVDLNVGLPISFEHEREISGQVDVILHGVDLQWTFWEAIGHRAPGALAVPGANAILPNVLALTKAARDVARAKSILTKDYHFELERREQKWNGEFHAPYNFPAHGMAQRGGPAGHEILWEVRAVFGDRVLTVPHHAEVTGDPSGEDRLELTPWQIEQHAAQVVDPGVQVVLQKNGPGSYDFAVNPRARSVVERIGPKRVYVYGVATDFCVRAAALTYRAWGVETFVVTDAIAGIYAEQIEETFTQWRAAGVRFTTTAEVLKNLGTILAKDE